MAKGQLTDRDAFVARWLWVLQDQIAAGDTSDMGVIVDALAGEFEPKIINSQ